MKTLILTEVNNNTHLFRIQQTARSIFLWQTFVYYNISYRCKTTMHLSVTAMFEWVHYGQSSAYFTCSSMMLQTITSYRRVHIDWWIISWWKQSTYDLIFSAILTHTSWHSINLDRYTELLYEKLFIVWLFTSSYRDELCCESIMGTEHESHENDAEITLVSVLW